MFKADLGVILFECLAGVPAELIVLALNVLRTLLVGVLLLGARGVVRPVLLHAAVHAVVAVLVPVATVILGSPFANLFLAVTRNALVRVRAKSTWQQVLSHTNYLPALRRKFLVLELRQLHILFLDDVVADG